MFLHGIHLHDKEKLMYIPNRFKMSTVIIYCYIDFFFFLVSKSQHSKMKCCQIRST